MDKVCQNDFLDEVNAKGEYIKNSVKSWELPFVTAIRGLGLMIGIEVTISHKEAVGKSLDSGLMMLTAGSNVLRMLPPLTITYEEINQGLEILKKVMLGYNI
jgi:acetylornithine/N-succinyldiaminopimelate aminotransferase